MCRIAKRLPGEILNDFLLRLLYLSATAVATGNASLKFDFKAPALIFERTLAVARSR